VRGWILDVRPDPERDLMDIWILDEGGKRTRISHRFHPVITVSGRSERLKVLREILADLGGVRDLRSDRRVLNIHNDRPVPCLDVEISDYSRIREIARKIERVGKFREFSLYDVDMRLASIYMMRYGIHPLAHVEIGSDYGLLEDPDWGKEPLPPVKALSLHVHPDKKGAAPLFSDRIGSVSVGDRDMWGGEEEMIRWISETLDEEDPDILVTAGGDAFVLPYLHHRAILNGVEEELVLDRSGEPFRAPLKDGRSYFSYGNIFFKPAARTLRGRLHLDLENSFILKEGGLIGLALLSRMSLIPMQDMARLSPGSAISYMECMEAKRRGRSVMWKKNLPEEWKDGIELARADRGGYIFDPLAGAYSQVAEMDFSSFYPHIMWKKNLSVETLNCSCCEPGEDNMVPGLNYHVCRKKKGLIPHVVGEILTRRLEYKKLSGGEERLLFPGEEDLGPLRPLPGKRYECASSILKWVLVTCFGYTGYKNARFGKIEAHESITAYSRELMLQAKEVVEEEGFRILHGIVDSLWIEGPIGKANRAAALTRERTGIPIEVDALYRWIVFLPNRTNGAGALTKYYGLKEDGSIKMRGIEARQRSTPPFIKSFQEELRVRGGDSR
jgi:DNA polymerase elongation subunit (family B)